MRITEVTAVLLTGPSSNDRYITFTKKLRTAAFIEVRTDVGLVGIGETYLGYFFPEAVPHVVDYIRPILVDADTTDPTVLTDRMRKCLGFWARVGAGAAALTGVESALWDLAGKAAGVPVYELLGGRRHDRLRAYATGGPAPWPVEELKRKLDRYAELGFTALKVATGYLEMERREEILPPPGAAAAAEFEAEKVALMRSHLGPDFGLMLDGHMGHRIGVNRWDLDTAIAVMDAVAPYGLEFFEEPLAYEDPDEYAELTRRSPVPIAGGEQLFSYEEFRLWMARDAFAIAQPDASLLSMPEFVKVSDLAASRGRHVVSHAWCAGVGYLQNIHAAFASESTLMIEMAPDAGELHTALWGDSMIIEDGYVLPPQAPGLGAVLSEEIKERYPFRPGAEEYSSVPGKILRS